MKIDIMFKYFKNAIVEMGVPEDIYDLNIIEHQMEFNYIQLMYHNMQKNNKEIIYEITADEIDDLYSRAIWSVNDEIQLFKDEITNHIIPHLLEYKLDLL